MKISHARMRRQDENSLVIIDLLCDQSVNFCDKICGLECGLCKLDNYCCIWRYSLWCTSRRIYDRTQGWSACQCKAPDRWDNWSPRRWWPWAMKGCLLVYSLRVMMWVCDFNHLYLHYLLLIDVKMEKISRHGCTPLEVERFLCGYFPFFCIHSLVWLKSFWRHFPWKMIQDDVCVMSYFLNTGRCVKSENKM